MTGIIDKLFSLATMLPEERAMQKNAELNMDVRIILHTDSAERLKQAQKTLRGIHRLTPQIRAIWVAEIIAGVTMTVMDDETRAQAGPIIYPTMAAGATYLAFLMRKIKNQKELFHQQMYNAYQESK